ncbi:MAG: hypothetical protein JXP34_01740 [Planctomycetes bacterium]|nr:hypothetical protein [Planctomycetota bacterium]
MDRAEGLDLREIASSFEDTADLLDVHRGPCADGEALRAAGRSIRQALALSDSKTPRSILGGLHGVKRAIVRMALDLHGAGRSAGLEALRSSVPSGLEDLLAIEQELSVHRLHILHARLGVCGPEDLEAACRSGKVAADPSFGRAWSDRLLGWAIFLRERRERRPSYRIRPLAERIRREIATLPGIARVEIAGELRRSWESAAGISFACAATDPRAAIEAIRRRYPVDDVRDEIRPVAQPFVRVAGAIGDGIRVEIVIASENAFGGALVEATGSSEHVEGLRAEARERGLSRGAEGVLGPDGMPREEGRTEEGIYAALGLAWIPPELREGRDEIERARRGDLPALVTGEDLRGLFHIHTIASDGRDTIDEVVRCAAGLGYAYVGISEHSASSAYAGGLSPAALRRQIEEIRGLAGPARRGSGVRVFAGVECDILPDGSLDYDDGLLGSLDFVIATLHSWDEQTSEVLTERVLRAIEHPQVRFLAHPTGRLLGGVPGYPLDMARILERAGELGVWVELNARPQRLDLDWRWGETARRQGVRIAISPDAHAAADLGEIGLGVGAARKGGFAAADVVNALPREAMEEILRADRRGSAPGGA